MRCDCSIDKMDRSSSSLGLVTIDICFILYAVSFARWSQTIETPISSLSDAFVEDLAALIRAESTHLFALLEFRFMTVTAGV